MRKGFKNAGFVALIILIGAAVIASQNQPTKLEQVPYSQVVSEANEGKYNKLTISGSEVEITEKDKEDATKVSQKDPNSTLADDGIDQSKVTVEYKTPSEGGGIWAQLGIALLPVILIGFILFFMLRSAQGQGNQAMSFGKSRARLDRKSVV